MSNYLREAFKELELLDEEVFPFDNDGAAELKNFMDGDITDDTESIIDPEAESEEDLQDSYEGKVVIQCKICGEKQYEDPEDIIIDEDSDYVNVGEECPSCSSVDGYKIIGQIAPYCPDCAAKDDIDVDIDIDDDELEEALGGKKYIKESRTLGKSRIRKARKLTESFDKDAVPENSILRNDREKGYILFTPGTKDEGPALNDPISLSDDEANYLIDTYELKDIEVIPHRGIQSRIGKKYVKEALNEKRETGLGDVVQQMLDGEFYDMVQSKKTGKMQSVGRKPLYNATDIGIDDDGLVIRVKDEAAAAPAKEIADKFGLKTAYEAPKKYQRDPRGFFHIYISEDEWDKDVSDIAFGKELKEEIFDPVREFYVEIDNPDEEDERVVVRCYLTRTYDSDFGNVYQISFGMDDYYDLDSTNKRDAIREAKESILDFYSDANPKFLTRYDGPIYEDIAKLSKGKAGHKRRPMMKECDDTQKPMTEADEDMPKQPTAYYRNKEVIGGIVFEDPEEGGWRFAKFYRPGQDMAEDDAYAVIDALGYDSDEVEPVSWWLEDPDYVEDGATPFAVDMSWSGQHYAPYDELIEFLTDNIEVKYEESLKESIENVTVETDTDTVTVTPEGSGDITVQTQSKGEPDAGTEVIVPVDNETKDEIDMNDHNYDETDIEDIDIDDIDIDGFDELGESYMKKVYGNVESYKTTSSKFDNKKLMIEGVITFKSGKKAKTNFIFENIIRTRSGKVKFIGENLQLSTNKRAFTITASVKDKKGICESFNYNYIAKDATTDKRVPLYGTIKK